MRRILTSSAAVLFLSGIVVANATAPRKTAKEVMKAGFAGDSSLIKKVLSGDSTDEDKKKLLDLLVDLVENDAPKGDAIEWKMQSGAAVLAAAKLVTGREGSLDELKTATNCKACHDKFKGK